MLCLCTSSAVESAYTSPAVLLRCVLPLYLLCCTKRQFFFSCAATLCCDYVSLAASLRCSARLYLRLSCCTIALLPCAVPAPLLLPHCTATLCCACAPPAAPLRCYPVLCLCPSCCPIALLRCVMAVPLLLPHCNALLCHGCAPPAAPLRCFAVLWLCPSCCPIALLCCVVAVPLLLPHCAASLCRGCAPPATLLAPSQYLSLAIRSDVCCCMTLCPDHLLWARALPRCGARSHRLPNLLLGCGPTV